MKAEPGPLPTGDDWAYELKWDGMRIQARCQPGHDVVLRSLSGRDVTTSFPELASLPDHLGISAVLDGEAVVFDGDRPSFGRLQHRMHVSAPTQVLVSSQPVVYILFDLLELDGSSTLDVPYESRHRLLTDLVDDGPSWRAPPSMHGDGESLVALARDRGLEGVVAKRRSSRYRPGVRTKDWRKIKITKRQEFVVGGWLPGSGQLAGERGSLVVGVWDAGSLRFSGAVGSGIDERARRMLDDVLVDSPVCPFDEVPVLDKVATWVEPTVVVEVSYGEWPSDGSLRHPVYAGLRPDKDPSDVTRELPPEGSGVG